MMRRSLAFLGAAGLLVAWWAAAGYSEPTRDARGFMRGKLVHSKAVLESLALEDFGGIARHAEQMKLLSLDANWQVIQSEEYVRHSADFRRSAAALAAAAEKKNLDGAVLAYFQLTQNCVNCHKYVRQIEHPKDK
jgi:hypothetical protein